MVASEPAPVAPITYTVGCDRPQDHRGQFTIDIPAVKGPAVDLVLPSWAPGSYRILVPSRAVRDMRAWAAGHTRPLPVTRVDKARWRIPTDGLDAVRVEYAVYGHEVGTKAVDFTDQHWFLNPVFCLPYVDGRTTEPLDVVIHLPAEWKAFSELREVDRHPPRLRAADYDELVDSPIDCGRPVELASPANGIPHRILLCGHGGNYEPHRLEQDLGRIAETTIRLFGSSPLTHYTWFFHLHDVVQGALEHRSSMSAVVPRTGFRPLSSYRRFLRLCAHEYFHLYNVKRIRPLVLGPFDYTRENYTRLLWAMEGTTEYYAHMLLRRAGLVEPKRLLEMLANDARRLRLVPGRAVTDLETASLQTWVDFYHPYEETVNQSVSYYLKGELVSLCLDWEIRRRTENRRSLDAVFRHLWTEYGQVGRGLEEDALQPVMETVTGLSLEDFFRRYVRGTEELDVGAFARAAGLELVPKRTPRRDDDDEPAGYLGIDHEEAGGTVRVVRVLEGGPARRAGLSPGDEIVAVNGSKVTPSTLPRFLAALPAGSPATLTVFRRGWLTTVSATVGEAPPERLEFRPVGDATDLERAVYESWLEATWEPSARTPEPDSPAGTALRP